MEYVLLTEILIESNPLDEIKATIAKYPEDNVFRKKCEMAVAVREERPFDAIRIAVELNGGNAMAGFIAEQIERAFQSPSSLEDLDLAYFLQKFRRRVKGKHGNLKESDHAYIREKYNRNNQKLTINQKREIAEHLGVHESKVHSYVNNLRDRLRKQQRRREQAEKEASERIEGSYQSMSSLSNNFSES